MASTFFGPVKRVLRKSGLTPEEFAYRVLPQFLLEIITRYLRVTVVGTRNIPSRGPYILISNHSGFMGFDALMLVHQVHQKKKVIPHIIAHKLWFLSPEISVAAKKFGLVPATFQNGLEILEQKEPLLLFPEGEEGNFKPSSKRYHLRRFRRGFVRLALETGAPIIPSVVIGAEETHLTLSQIRWAKHLIGTVIPIPLNVIPLPAKWKIHFLPAIRLPKNPKLAADNDYVTALSKKIRLQLQRAMNAELKKRKKVFL